MKHTGVRACTAHTHCVVIRTYAHIHILLRQECKALESEPLIENSTDVKCTKSTPVMVLRDHNESDLS